MKRETYYHGRPGLKWGIWNAQRKQWQFGISEDTPMLAEARLFQRIGDNARKWRFEPRPLPAKQCLEKDDPVHKMGGCYCEECDYARDPIDEKLVGKLLVCGESCLYKENRSFCSSGKRKETKED